MKSKEPTMVLWRSYCIRQTGFLRLLISVLLGAALSSTQKPDNFNNRHSEVEPVTRANCRVKWPSNYQNAVIFTRVFKWTPPSNSCPTAREFVSHGDTVQFCCKNGFIQDELRGCQYTFECYDGKFNNTFEYDDLSCKSSYHQNTRISRSFKQGFGNGILSCQHKDLELYEVAVKKSCGSSLPLYWVCFDRSIMRPKYSFYVPRAANNLNKTQKRNSVWALDYFGRNAREKLWLTKGFTSKFQKERITKAFPHRYNKGKKYPFSFNRGHLTAYSDFEDLDAKKATCAYINVALQWDAFNGNSWSLVEKTTRQMVERNPENWQVYTGTHGTIGSERGPLFMSPVFDERQKFVKAYVPIPKLYWKLAYNTRNKTESRVFIGVNNPELKTPDQFTSGYLICKPKLLGPKTHFKGSEFKGYVYECDLDEFMSVLARTENVVGPSL